MSESRPTWNKTRLLVKLNASIEDVMRLIKKTAFDGRNSAAVRRVLEHVPYENYGNDFLFLAAVFDYIAKAVYYKNDDPDLEQIKTPDRFLLKDGYGDCDDYAVLWGAVLNHLNKKFYFKIVKYDPNGGWAHIYVVAPIKGGTNIVLDNVLGQFNKEVSHVENKLY